MRRMYAILFVLATGQTDGISQDLKLARPELVREVHQRPNAAQILAACTE